jgi:hypothetical protein
MLHSSSIILGQSLQFPAQFVALRLGEIDPVAFGPVAFGKDVEQEHRDIIPAEEVMTR